MNEQKGTEVITHSQQESSPAEMIRQAVNAGADLEKLEKLLALQERWDAAQAKKAYHQAMSDFKANPPKIDKDKKVGYSTSKGKVGYSYASLANICAEINPALSRNGLSASWRHSQQNGSITVTCRITHAMGHYEETSLSAQPDDSGSKNSIQAIGSTNTYLEKYTLLSLTGLATYDQDDEDQSSGGEKIGDRELHNLRDQFIELDVNESKLLQYMGIEKLEDMFKADYPKAQALLQAKRDKVKVKK